MENDGEIRSKRLVFSSQLNFYLTDGVLIESQNDQRWSSEDQGSLHL